MRAIKVISKRALLRAKANKKLQKLKAKLKILNKSKDIKQI